MRRLDRMILRTFIPLLMIAVLFFVLLLQIIDLFGNIWRYLSHGVNAAQIVSIALLYVPKCVSYSLPVAFLFAISYTLGIFYTNNELFAIFCSGVSLTRLVTPFLVLGFALSVGMFLFEDAVVIPTFHQKSQSFAAAVQLVSSESQSNVTVISGDERAVYQADYYNDAQKRINGVTIIIRRGDGGLDQRVDAAWGEWNATRWILHDCRVFTWDPAARALRDKRMDVLDSGSFNEPPGTFKRLTRNVEEMQREDAASYVSTLRRAGFSYRAALTDYYRKFSFACTPLVVALIASSLGSTFRKNILLMSLLTALVISVVYYVAQMLMAILSKNGYIPPLAAAWSPFVVFILLGGLLFRSART
jgi:lipopolysaccharide export system permease protein